MTPTEALNKLTDEEKSQLAKRIVDALFTNAFDDRADRLILVRSGRDLGGWNERGAEIQIQKVLNGYTGETK